MRALFVTLLTYALVLLSVAPATAQEGAGRCVLVSTNKGANADAARAARDALGAGAVLLQLKGLQPAQLIAQCTVMIVAVGRPALKAAAAATTTTPIVYTMVSSPEQAVAAQTNVRGVAMDADPNRVFELLKAANPGLRRIGTVYDPRRTQGLVDAGKVAAAKLGLELVAIEVSDVGEALKAFRQFESKREVDALWLLPDGTATAREAVYYALELAQWKRIPVVGLSRWYVASGALFALAPRADAMGRRAGHVAKRIVDGQTVEPLDFGGDYELTLNRRTATRLGLELPKDLVSKAVEVIE